MYIYSSYPVMCVQCCDCFLRCRHPWPYPHEARHGAAIGRSEEGAQFAVIVGLGANEADAGAEDNRQKQREFEESVRDHTDYRISLAKTALKLDD